MRIKLVVSLLIATLFTSGSALGQGGSFTLDAVTGAIDATSLDTGTAVSFHLRMTNSSGAAITGLTNGFRVYSPDGATWDTTDGVSTGAITTAMVENFFVNSFSPDGMGADTVGFGGFRIMAPGIPTGFDLVVYDINLGTIHGSSAGKTLCLDSSFYPPAATWKWSTTGGDVFPSWDGPHCWEIAPATGGGPSGYLLDNATGLLPGDTIPTGQMITYSLRMQNNSGGAVVGLTNGFRVYSPTGADWDTTLADTTGAITTAMVENFFINDFSTDGLGADTLGFGGFRLFASGVPDGFDAVVYTITVGPLTAGSDGGVLCLDSTFYPPASTWKWSTDLGDVIPEWDGPHCYPIKDTTSAVDLPPALAAIGSRSVTECDTLSFGVSATDPQGYPLRLTAAILPGTATFTDNGDGTGNFFWVTSAGDAGLYDITFTAIADMSGLSDAEVITVTVNPNQPPVFAPIADQSVVVNNLLTFTVAVTDPEAGQITLVMSSGPAGATFVVAANTGILSWTPLPPEVGVYMIVFTAGDDCSNTVLDTVMITVTGPSLPSSITLDAVSNIWMADSIRTGVPIRFDLRLTNNSGSAVTGFTNGFRIYSPTGANWTTTVPDTTGAITAGMVENIFLNGFSIDGAGADTVGFGGFRILAPGIPSGFDDVVFSITIGPIDPVYCGEEICLDSAFYPPAATWKWSTTGGDVLPDWDGPHCFTVWEPACLPPSCTAYVAPDLLSFATDSCSGAPPCQVFAVGGDCPIDSVTWSSSWLSVLPDTGRTFMVCTDIAGLSPGLYFDTIWVSASQSSNSPFGVIVDLLIDTCATPDPSFITVDHVDTTDCSAVFHLRLTNNTGVNITGFTTGFRVYSPTGGTWGATQGDTTGAITAGMIENIFINDFSTDGMGEDTVGFGGFRLLAPGIPAGFSEIVYTVSIGPLAPGQGRQQFCIDSSFYPPAGIWKWSTTAGDAIPDWDGPHCVWLDCPPLCSLSVPALTVIDVCQNQDPACYSVNPGCVIDSVTNAPSVAWNSITLAGDSLVICPQTASLAVGSYEDTIKIWSSLAANSPALTHLAVNVTDTGACASCPPADCFTGFVETGISYPYLIHSELACGLAPGDEIGLFDGDLLVGALVYCDQTYPLVVNAWGADPTHSLPGYTPGNPVTIKVCKEGSGDIFCTTPYGSCLLFEECTFGIVDSLECHSCCVNLCTDILPDRWRTISFPANPLFADVCGGPDITCDIPAVFGGLNNLDIVKDDHGGVYIPAFFVNTLGCIDYCEGYDLFKYNAIEPLCIVGMPIAPAPCNVQASRWNILGYPLMCEMPIDVALATIVPRIDIVKDDDGGVYIPDFFVNTIGNMISGKGYKIFLKGPGDVSLQYPSCPALMTSINHSGSSSKQVRPQTKHYKFVETGLTYPVVIDGIGDMLKTGDEIAVFDGEICVGAAVYQGENTLVVPTWKGDPEHDLIGYTAGNLMDVRFHRDARGESSLLAGDDVFRFEESSYAVIDVSKGSTLPTAYSLSPNYPNPFNPSTTFGFALPKAGHVTLEVFNVLGRRVATLVDQYYEAGSHEVTWNVQTDSDRPVSTGMYLYRLQVNDYVETRKMMVLK